MLAAASVFGDAWLVGFAIQWLCCLLGLFQAHVGGLFGFVLVYPFEKGSRVPPRHIGRLTESKD